MGFNNSQSNVRLMLLTGATKASPLIAVWKYHMIVLTPVERGVLKFAVFGAIGNLPFDISSLTSTPPLPFSSIYVCFCTAKTSQKDQRD